ncbi:pyridoxal-dependent decarboxylase [Phascolomyces articulosus]|uniref:Pyridoxal-dependent decarboxylase n=1 Tax=Phascolomyces articulosus TaxID=60185 RepID=A0AAD5JLL4_9FUNG|nr:pyridoxal-dependent decarboxylase [Phascolomyces articulosus]
MQFIKILLNNLHFVSSKNTQKQKDNHHDAPLSQQYDDVKILSYSNAKTAINKHSTNNNSIIDVPLLTRTANCDRDNSNNSSTTSTVVFDNSAEEAIRHQLDKITPSSDNYDTTVDENPFFIGDLGHLHRQYLKWKSLLPRIEPFYAVKCNPDSVAIQYLASLGMGFDCASKMEIQQVLELGADPDQIIYAQPVKQPSFLRYASQNNVSLMTFDNEDELYKIKEIYPNAKLVLRILVDDFDSAIPLGCKYGAPLGIIDRLLQTIKGLGLDLVGVSFHVGSGCSNDNAFYHAVVRARHVFDRAETFGYQLSLLDVGGGFNDSSVVEGTTFEKVAAVLGPTVDELFPSKDVRVIAEPGRYFVGGPAYTFCFGIIGRRVEESNDHQKAYDYSLSLKQEKNDQENYKLTYYINDGFYGTFQMPILDQLNLNLRVLRKKDIYFYGRELDNNEKKYPCTIWGPTCCSLDRIQYDGYLPELHVGDWLYLENFGAYTIAGASTFNGYEKPKIIHVNSYYDP